MIYSGESNEFVENLTLIIYTLNLNSDITLEKIGE